MTTQKSNLWYKNPFIIFFVIGLPLIVVVACIWFVFYAVKHQDSTVRDDWYMDGKALYQDASKDQLAYDLGVAGIMRFDGEQVQFELNFPKDTLESQKFATGEPLTYPPSLAVSISHATDKTKDRDFVLTHQNANTYTGMVSLDTAIPAKYYLKINTPDGYPLQWRLIHAQKLPAQSVSFVPLSAFKHQGNSPLDVPN